MRHPLPAALTVAFVVFAGCDDGSARPVDIVLAGRVFAADEAKPLTQALVVAPSGEKTTTGSEGTFEIRTGEKQASGRVTVTSNGGAPVSKPAPERGGYIELYVKSYDAQQETDPAGRVTLTAKNKAGVTIGKNLLEHADGTKPRRARVGIAAPNPKKRAELSSIPGDFDAKKGNKRGKVSTRSALYVVAADGDKPLKLSNGAHGKVTLPADTAEAQHKSAGVSLFRLDETAGVWVEEGTAQLVGEGDAAVYAAEVSSLGWWAVGDFYDQLTCIRGCVRDTDQKPASSARVIVTGIDHVGELTTYAGSDGCFALDVRAESDVHVAAQIDGGFAGGAPIKTRAELRRVQDDPSACQDIGTLRVATANAESCPLGFSACADACVDTRSDLAHCGACDQRCSTECVAGRCGGASEPPEPAVDGGAPEPEPAPDAGPDDTSDAGTGVSEYVLWVEHTGSGQGMVEVSSQEQPCSGLCSYSFSEGAVATLSAAPQAGSTFAGWSGDCAGTEGSTCRLLMSIDRNAGALFELDRTLTVDASAGNGSGTVIAQVDGAGPDIISCGANGGDCAETVPYGTSVTLTARATSNSAVVWGGACVGATGSTCTLTITDLTHVAVTFSLLEYTLTVRVRNGGVEPAGDGTVSSVPSGIDQCHNIYQPEVVCRATFTAGTAVQLNAAPSGANSFFLGWGGACDGTETPCSVQINADTDVSADFGGIIF